MLALIAVPPALGFAWASLHAIRVSMPANIMRFVPGFDSLGPDLRLLGVHRRTRAVLTACIFGLLPALQASRSQVSEALKEGGRSSTGRQLLRRGIVIAEISIALPLLVAAGLGVLGTNRFLNGPQGYDPDGVLTMKLVLPDRTYHDAASQRRFVERAIDALAAVPGVEHAAIDQQSAGVGIQFVAGDRDRRPSGAGSEEPAGRRQPRGDAGLLHRHAHPDSARPRVHRPPIAKARRRWSSSASRWRRSTGPARIRSAAG